MDSCNTQVSVYLFHDVISLSLSLLTLFSSLLFYLTTFPQSYCNTDLFSWLDSLAFLVGRWNMKFLGITNMKHACHFPGSKPCWISLPNWIQREALQIVWCCRITLLRRSLIRHLIGVNKIGRVQRTAYNHESIFHNGIFSLNIHLLSLFSLNHFYGNNELRLVLNLENMFWRVIDLRKLNNPLNHLHNDKVLSGYSQLSVTRTGPHFLYLVFLATYLFQL